MTTQKQSQKPQKPQKKSDLSAQAEKQAELTKVERRQALMEHLRALRKVLVVCFSAMAIVFFLLFYLVCQPLVDFVMVPLRQREIHVIYTAVSEALMMRVKTCLVAAVVVAMPVIIWQLWGFISPALYPNEKKMFKVLFFVALVLFMLGVAFSYVVVFPMAINLFLEAGQDVAAAMWSVDQYFNFVLSFVLPFGLMFEMPVVIYMMAHKGMVNYEQLAKSRRFVILAIAVVAAILTPPDVVSQVLLGIPMLLLYEVGVQVARLAKPKTELTEA